MLLNNSPILFEHHVTERCWRMGKLNSKSLMQILLLDDVVYCFMYWELFYMSLFSDPK
jgi:hypothetical protein